MRIIVKLDNQVSTFWLPLKSYGAEHQMHRFHMISITFHSNLLFFLKVVQISWIKPYIRDFPIFNHDLWNIEFHFWCPPSVEWKKKCIEISHLTLQWSLSYRWSTQVVPLSRVASLSVMSLEISLRNLRRYNRANTTSNQTVYNKVLMCMNENTILFNIHTQLQNCQ